MIDLIKCPFCGESDFDLPGLKRHLEVYCEVWPTVQRISCPPFPRITKCQKCGMEYATDLNVTVKCMCDSAGGAFGSSETGTMQQELTRLRARVENLENALRSYSVCGDGCTCGDGWSHDIAIAALVKKK